IKKDHIDGNEAKATCMLETSVNGSVYKALGTVQTAVPVLLEMNGSVFRQPVALAGNLLFFRAATSPQLLPSVTGVLAAAGVEIDHFSASSTSGGDHWYCVGVSCLLKDFSTLMPLVKEAAQLTV
ncbi:D-3-phosphoglycerate dehydrogenase, partial [Tachysurus ichikawai]